eukprot:9174449-Pyramimonas_sp.AAC.1
MGVDIGWLFGVGVMVAMLGVLGTGVDMGGLPDLGSPAAALGGEADPGVGVEAGSILGSTGSCAADPNSTTVNERNMWNW